MIEKLGFSIHIFMPGEDPDGIRLVEKDGWIGLGAAFPYDCLRDAAGMDKLQRPGVYVIWGQNEELDSQKTSVYIGEGQNVATRLEQHNKDDEKKSFWQHTATFTSNDGRLNIVHTKHIESRLLAMMRLSNVENIALSNSQKPNSPVMAEAERAYAERFFSEMLLCFPIMGVEFFVETWSNKNQDVWYSLEEVRNKITVKAKGREGSNRTFLVKEGSCARKDLIGSVKGTSIEAIQKELIETGVFEDAGETYRMTRNFLFSSASKAAHVLLGSDGYGPAYWKRSNTNLKEIRDKRREIIPKNIHPQKKDRIQ